MLGQVNEFRRFAHAANCRLLNGLRFARQRNYAAVVVSIHLPVKKVNALHLHGLGDGMHFRCITTFRKIGNTLDQRGHRVKNIWVPGAAATWELTPS